jgi:hypothetical protein
MYWHSRESFRVFYFQSFFFLGGIENLFFKSTGMINRMVDNSESQPRVNVEHYCQENILKEIILENESEIAKLQNEIEQLKAENKE